MFYSQFILAKKGPLGTIWIAAHLERKLRKNQVADTDIGVSVDSILFPEVPIALRLSSHLLLGVVRIYSRKVNYLFDDCSEALLKIKQAFRSTAVDLPPEESTAPYHSITLPETFDLDDFELPDSDIFQGNYVDHHVSTREQITLQDTMEGVVYSTSQFGLDERFGDGDTSQVGLDLEEDLFLDKVTKAGHDEVSENDTQISTGPVQHPKTDTSFEKITGASEDMPLNGTTNKSNGRAGNLEVIDYAQAPSTPGLVEEPNVSSAKEGLACDDHLESEDHNLRKLVGIDSSENVPSKFNLQHRDDTMQLLLSDHLNHDTIVKTPAEENNHLSGDLEIIQSGLEGDFISSSITTEHIQADLSVSELDGLDRVERTDKIVSCNNEQTIPSKGQINGVCEESLGVGIQGTVEVEVANSIEESHSNGRTLVSNRAHSLELPSAPVCVIVEGQDCQGQEDIEKLIGHDNYEERAPDCTVVLRACNSNLNHPDTSSHEVGNFVAASALQSTDAVLLSSAVVGSEEGFHTSGTSAVMQDQEYHVTHVGPSEENWIAEPTLSGQIQAYREKQDEQLASAASNDKQCENLNSFMTSDLAAPEKLLSMPSRLLDEPHDLLVETPDKEVQEVVDGSGAGTNFSGKKRSFAESTPTMHSLNSVQSFGATISKGTAVDSIPDDDDLLSSILVGRRSSVLKMKPTPPAPEVPSMKRTRSVSRPSALKRKVPMDDSMVLHGDTIRQQLANTEDIRRLRKKAPCTRTEILMIQRQFLEEEIFSEPVLTGMLAELTHLHREAFDLSRIRVSKHDDDNSVSFEVMNNEDSAKQTFTQGFEIEGVSGPISFRNDTAVQPSELPVQVDNERIEDHISSHSVENQNCVDGITDLVDYRTSEHEHLGEISEMEIDKVSADVADATDQSVPELEPLSRDSVEMPTGTIDQSAATGKTIGTEDFMQMNASNLPSEEIGTQQIKEVAFVQDMSNGIELDGIEVADHCTDQSVTVGTEFGTGGEKLEESKAGVSIEVKEDVIADGSVATDDVDTSLANMSSEAGGCIDHDSVNVDQGLEEIENGKLGVHSDDRDLIVSLGCPDDKDKTSNDLCNEESKTESTYPALDGDFKSAPTNGDHTECQQADLQSTIEVQNAPFEHFIAGDCSDFQDVAFANDTEFLNVDDDEIGDGDVDDDDEGMPNAEDSHLLDNSGWSSRTRAVAKFLQTLFDKEAAQGRKVISMENLLAGKTRKEASRMFFETLVLKTRDYVQVEQAKPFENINIKPRAKLVKSDF